MAYTNPDHTCIEYNPTCRGKFDLTTAHIITETIRKGGSYSCAAGLAEICEKTLYLWIERGERGEKEFVTFVKELRKAIAERELNCIKKLEERSSGGTEFYLERNPLHRKNYSKKSEEEKRILDQLALLQQQIAELKGGAINVDNNKGLIDDKDIPDVFKGAI